MTRLIHAELLKLRSVRLPYGLLAAAAGLTALTVALAASGKADPLRTAPGLTVVVTSTQFALLLAALFGLTASTGEFRHGTATATYLASPDRTRVMMAKAVAAGAAGLLFGLVAAGMATGVALLFVKAHGFPVALSAATMLRFGAGATLAAGLFAAAGVALGSLIRHQLGAIVTVFAWAFLIESIVGSLYPGVGRYLPFTVAFGMAGTPAGDTAALAFGAAAALLVGLAVALGAVASVTAVRRDIA